MKNLERYLETFPLREKDAFEQLQTLVAERHKNRKWKQAEKVRLEYELSVICNTNTACVFLFFYDTVRALKGINAIFYGTIHCSYLCYLLGITKINPMQYDLPFERYFGSHRKHLPQASLVVKAGAKGRVIQYLKQRYGADRTARIQDSSDEYIVSNKSLLEVGGIRETILRSSINTFVWHEDVSFLKWREVLDLGLYTISIREADMTEVRAFREEEIYQRALAWFEEYRAGDKHFRLDDRYFGNAIAEEIFANTDGKYIYQEQFYEICTQILGVSNKKADEFRKALLLRRKTQIEEIKELFMWRMGEEGLALFEYIKSRHSYVVTKAYIIGLLFLDFGEE